MPTVPKIKIPTVKQKSNTADNKKKRKPIKTVPPRSSPNRRWL